MFVYVKVEYHSSDDWGKVDWELLRCTWPAELPEEKPKDHYALGHYSEPVRLTLEEADAVARSGLKMNLVAPPGNQFTKKRNRNDWEPDAQILPDHLRRGEAVQISVADVGLLLIDEVDFMEDACTHSLQSALDDGWRILAVCPPCAQRRPDYILGRRKK